MKRPVQCRHRAAAARFRRGEQFAQSSYPNFIAAPTQALHGCAFELGRCGEENKGARLPRLPVPRRRGSRATAAWRSPCEWPGSARRRGAELVAAQCEKMHDGLSERPRLLRLMNDHAEGKAPQAEVDYYRKKLSA